MGGCDERRAYLLAGPTASGKSAIAAALAREMGAWILSADSMNVYRGMDVGTAKPSAAEREEFHMGGVDIVTPAEEFSSGAWLRAAAEWMSGVPEDVPMVIVGGTGLYFSALLRGLDRRWEKPPPEYPVIRIDRAVVRERIAARLDDMFLAGLDEEKRRLREQYPVWSRTASLAIGYRDGDDRAKILTRTCQLAKRQDTWFRHQATPIYVEPTVEAVRECWRTRGPWPVARFLRGCIRLSLAILAGGFLLGALAAPTNAESTAQGAVKYAPVPGGFAARNGDGEFNRPLYGWHGDDRELAPCKSLPWSAAERRHLSAFLARRSTA